MLKDLESDYIFQLGKVTKRIDDLKKIGNVDFKRLQILDGMKNDLLFALSNYSYYAGICKTVKNTGC